MADNTLIPNDGYLARFFQRDSDTLLGWGNTGLLMFAIFHEWGDSYDPATGATGTIEGERYDAATDSFEPSATAGTPVFNGRLSGLWDCVSQAWPDDLAAMYRSMRAAGFNADDMWQLYQSFRQQWCEALYAADAMGYANTGRFDMAYGDKSEALRHIFKARFRYLDSKYGANTSAPLEFRLWGNGKGVALRYYCPLYASLNWGAGGIITERAITPGEPSYFPNPGTTFNETTFTVYNADLLTEISTYTELPDGTRVEGGLEDLATRLSASGLGNCKRLKRLVLDYNGREANTNLDGRVLEACRSVALRVMTVRNCPNVIGHADFASQVIEEIDLQGTGVTGITVPETDTLRSVALGSAASDIDFAGMHGLESLTLQGIDNLAIIKIHDCPKLDIRPILFEALRGDVLREVRLTDVNYINFSAQYLSRLADIGATITGTLSLPASDNMSFALKKRCLEVWGNIDSPTNPLKVNYTSRPVDIVRISGAGYFATPGDYQLDVISDDPYANDFTKIEWSMTPNGYAEIDTLTGRVRVTRVGTEELAPTAEVTVTIHKTDGTTVTKSTTVGFYERACRLGDYVFYDGSYGPDLEAGKTVVGICFWINPKNPKQRLCIGLKEFRSYGWGISETGIFTGLTLADDLQYSPFDIRALPNRSSLGIDGKLTSDNYRDETQPDGFKIMDANTALSELGFITIEEDLGPYKNGAELPWGMVNTLHIIAHRNKILSDSNVNLLQPKATADETVMQSLIRLMSDIVAENDNNNQYSLYYYPLASLCNCFEPTVKAGENLADCFKSGMWFMPSAGELGRLAWYHCCMGYDVDNKDAIFAKPAAAGILPQIITRHNTYNSSTEYNSSMVYGLQPWDGSLSGGLNKGSFAESSWPIAAF